MRIHLQKRARTWETTTRNRTRRVKKTRMMMTKMEERESEKDQEGTRALRNEKDCWTKTERRHAVDRLSF